MSAERSRELHAQYLQVKQQWWDKYHDSIAAREAHDWNTHTRLQEEMRALNQQACRLWEEGVEELEPKPDNR